jgi:hypothetical protein
LQKKLYNPQNVCLPWTYPGAAPGRGRAGKQRREREKRKGRRVKRVKEEKGKKK